MRAVTRSHAKTCCTRSACSRMMTRTCDHKIGIVRRHRHHTIPFHGCVYRMAARLYLPGKHYKCSAKRSLLCNHEHATECAASVDITCDDCERQFATNDCYERHETSAGLHLLIAILSPSFSLRSSRRRISMLSTSTMPRLPHCGQLEADRCTSRLREAVLSQVGCEHTHCSLFLFHLTRRRTNQS